MGQSITDRRRILVFMGHFSESLWQTSSDNPVSRIKCVCDEFFFLQTQILMVQKRNVKLTSYMCYVWEQE